MLSIVAVLIAATVLFVFGGVLSAISFALCGFMGWTRAFRLNAAAGKPTLSGGGRVAVAVCLAVIGVVLLPRGAKEPYRVEQASEPTFGKAEAMDVCKKRVLASASHPSTVKFPILDYDYHDIAGGRTQLLMSAKAKNGFGLELEYDVQCDFAGSELADFVMSEAGR